MYYGGLFDGEGTVYISQPNRLTSVAGFALYAAVTMTDAAPLVWLVRDFGGQLAKSGVINPPKIRRQPYKWCVCANKAARFLSAIRPYTMVKAPQIDVAIEFQNRKDSVGRSGRHGLSLEERRWRMEMSKRLKELKTLFVHGELNGIRANSVNAEIANTELNESFLFDSKCVETKRPTGSNRLPEDIVQSIRN